MRFSCKFGITAVVLLLPCTSPRAAELVILRNGFAISYERRETRNTVTRLYLTENSNAYVDVSTGQILRFQVEDLDLPEIPSPSVSPGRHFDAVSSAATARNKIDSGSELDRAMTTSAKANRPRLETYRAKSSFL